MLWVASASGLFQFDGIRFVQVQGKPGGALSLDTVWSLYAPPTGGLWVGLRFGGLVFLEEDQITEYPPGDELPESTVNAIAQDHSGALWASTNAGLMRFQSGRWKRLGGEWGLPPGYVLSLFVDRAGAVWATGKDGLYVLRSGARQFTKDLADLSMLPPVFGQGFVAESPDGMLWVWDHAKGVRPIRGNRILPLPQATIVQFDQEGALWFSTGDDVRRLTNAREFAEKGAAPVIERFGRADGLLGDASIFFKDREGDIWVGSGEGIDMFVPTSLRMVRTGDAGYGMARARDGSMWWSEYDYNASRWHIAHFSRDRVVDQLSIVDPIFGAYAEENGTLWFTGLDKVWHFDGKRLQPLPSSNPVPGVDTQALVRGRDGALWRSVARGGVFRYAGGEWQLNGGLATLPRDPAIVMTADAAGRLWFGYTKNRIALLDGDSVQMLGVGDGLDVGNVTAIETRGEHVWVGGEHGLMRFVGGRFVPVRVSGENPYRNLWGLVETRAGELWAAGGRRLIRLDRNQLAEVLAHRGAAVSPQLFDYRDGVAGAIQAMRPLPSLREDGDGRVWFALSTGLGFVDPAHVVLKATPPPVSIQSVMAGGREYSPFLRAIRFPTRTTQLRIGYTAASFAAPERIRFRYRLEGLDKDWQNVGEQREAVYTNLSPGTYRFSVTAANRDSPWSAPGAGLEVTIPPTFYQTTWFYVICSLFALAVLWLLYRLRLRQATTAVRARLEERIVERERIARDLHDTLLQGLQGLILRFQAAAARVPTHEPARDMLERALERADDVLLESRHRVKDLRASTQMQGDLADALGAFGKELAQEKQATEFSVTIGGAPRALHPVVREEAFMIGREALFNAFRHSGGGKIEVEITFNSSELRLRIRDDGCGVEPSLLAAGGRSGHWGMHGMRERAKKIRSQLEIWSRRDMGTEVELRVPAALAYRSSSKIRPETVASSTEKAPEH
ncbi:MAG: triple tyrosine motif-containing protein [Gammaproteobacteria bacterium]